MGLSADFVVLVIVCFGGVYGICISIKVLMFLLVVLEYQSSQVMRLNWLNNKANYYSLI